MLALNTAGVVDNKTLYEAAGINRITAEAYERLLQNLYVVEAVPAWSANRLKRLIKMPKRYLVDAGLAAATTNVDETLLLRDNNLLGRLLDTFVTAQFRAELAACPSRPRLHHLRTEGGRQEIDLIVELSGGRILGIEIKAAAAVDERSFLTGAEKHRDIRSCLKSIGRLLSQFIRHFSIPTVRRLVALPR